MTNTNTPTDQDDYVSGTKGADVLSGGAGKDQFSFHTDYPNDFNRDTLDDGDRITDYEFEEEIDIVGVRLGSRNVTLEYDAANNQTRLKLDLDKDGTVDRTIILDGDKRGQLQVDANCCTTPTTTIKIKQAAQTNVTYVEPDQSSATMIDLEDIGFHEGTEGLDIIFALAGTDVVYAAGGADTIIGGDGDDTLNGGAGPDLIGGGRGNDTLNGDAGDDELHGGLGNDTLNGGADNDYLSGEEGADTLNGGTGNDTLRGGADADTLTGGAGDDTFVFSPGDIAAGEKITDYEYGEKIDIGGISNANQVKLTANGNGSILEMDLDNNGTFETQLGLDGVTGGTIIVLPNEGGLRILNQQAGTDGHDKLYDTGLASYVVGGAGNDIYYAQGSVNDVFVDDCNDLIAVGDFGERDLLRDVEFVKFEDGLFALADYSCDPVTDTGPTEIFRFFNTETGTHFFTASAEEKDYVIANNEMMSFEGAVFSTNANADTGIAVYRFFNTDSGTHFYTASADERLNLIENSPSLNYEGIAYYAYAEDNGSNTELFRFFNTETGGHVYIANPEERESINANLPQFNDEGVAYYVDFV